MGNCKDCKWWGRIPRDIAHGMKWDLKECDYAKSHPKTPASMLLGITGPDFGCIHFEPTPISASKEAKG